MDAAPKTVRIYGLIDPRTNELRYVGQTHRPLGRRLSQHCGTARKRTTLHVAAWIRGVLDAGSAPEMIVLQECSASLAEESEQFWIEYFRWVGCDLTNRSIGGLAPRGWHHTEEQKAKWRETRSGENAPMYGKRWTPAQRKRASEAQKQRFQTQPHPRVGKKHTEETRRIIRERLAAAPPRVFTEAGRQAKSDAAKRRWADPEWRKRFSERMSGDRNHRFGKRPPDHQIEAVKRGHRKGFKHPPETIERMREAARRRVERTGR